MLGITLGLVLIVLVVFFLPTAKVSFRKLYAQVPADASQSLQAFRGSRPLKLLFVENIPWNYISLGQGPETILLLHGRGGTLRTFHHTGSTGKVELIERLSRN